MNPFWNFACPPNITFGRGSISHLENLIARSGMKCPVIVSDHQVLSISAVQSTISQCRRNCGPLTVFDGGQAEPQVEIATKAYQLAMQNGADGVIAIGGGSNIDVAKVLAVLMRYGGVPEDYFGFNRVPGATAPLIAIPTTAGTGSEVSHSAVLTDPVASVKVSTLSPFLRPAFALIDPQLTDSCPSRVTAHSGIDALVHAIEAYTNKSFAQISSNASSSLNAYEGSYPLTSLLALEAIEIISQNLVRAYENPNNHDARDSMAYAAMLAGLAFSNSGVGLVHALEYPIGVLSHCSHGEGNGLLLPHVMQFNLPMCAAKLANVASIWSKRPMDSCTGEDAIQIIQELLVRIGIRTQLRELGVQQSDFSFIAERTLPVERLMNVTARKPSLEDVMSILNAAY